MQSIYTLAVLTMPEKIQIEFTDHVGYITFVLYNKFQIILSIQNWEFMCHYRWFTKEPNREDVETEFGACGARDANDNIEANEIVQKTINTYKRIMNENIVDDCRKLLQTTSKSAARIDKQGNIYIEEVTE